MSEDAEREAYRRGARDVLEVLHRLASSKVSVPNYRLRNGTPQVRSRWRDAWAVLVKKLERGEWPSGRRERSDAG